MAFKIKMTNVAGSIKIESAATPDKDFADAYIKIANIEKIYGHINQAGNNSNKDGKSVLIIIDMGSHKETYDVGSIDNQPTWTRDLAGLNTALATINAWT